ncbi:MAG: hypothetical protein QG657_5232, partial [Acidobacteriota bacterium]|nr:hypothetical protein [Acidobacteriota bacterium]
STDYTDYTDGRGAPPWSPDIIRNFIRPFDLSKSPLLRVGLVRLAEEKHLFLVDMHHIISDGMSTQVLVHDFSTLYAGRELPGINIQYKDYAEWQNRERVSKNIPGQGEFWKKEFEGEIPILELPADYSRPYVQDFEGNRIHFEINRDAFNALKILALETGATLYIVLLALYSIFLSKLSSQEDIVIGSPVAGRRHADLEKIIGMFVNTLALRNYPVGEKMFRDFLGEVKERTLKAFENQEYQYEDLVEKVTVTRDVSRNPLFDTMFALQNTGSREIELPGLKLIPYEKENKTSKFDLTLTGVEVEAKLMFTFEYSTKLFREETINRFITYFKNIVSGLIENKERRISDFEIITAEEKRQILFDFNDTGADYPKDKTIHQLFVEQALKTPDRVAIISHGRIRTKGEEEKRRREEEKNEEDPFGRINTFGGVHISYRELNEQSGRLAGMLIEKGVLADNIVAIMMERCVEMVIGILGILKSGGAYLPIDPDYPQERIDYMLKDSGAQLTVTNDVFSSSFPTSYLPNFLTSHPFSLAYVIYTSGSTGKPKGVMVEHSPVVNLLFAMQHEYPLEVSDTYLLKTSYVIDVSVTELFGWYMGGSRAAVLEKEGHKDPRVIVNSIERNRVTHINFVPSMFNAFIEQLTGENKRRISSLKYIFLAGEALLPELVEKFGNSNTGITLENIYGPTESTVYASKYSLSAWNGIGSIPIGKPLPNIELYILNKDNYLHPVGVGGELCISGFGLARGYLNRPELTCEKFIKYRTNRTNRTYINYKTGDLARWLPDGNIEFMGRIDHQVKIRGFRIELGEIESRLMKYPGIKESVVLMQEEGRGDKYLCAYIVPNRELVISELREFLSMELPEYMIPSYFVQLEKIPLTPNGKVDRRALPKPGLKASESYTAPRDEIETKLVDIWSDVLGGDALHASQLQTSIGIDDNFFHLGGHSLKTTILASRIEKTFNVKIPLSEIFKNPRIRKLSGYIKDAVQWEYTRIESVEKKEYYPLSSAQKRLYFLQVMEETGVAYNMPLFMKLEGKIDLEKLESTFGKLIQRHESIRTSFFMVDEEPVQRIHEHKNSSTDYTDYTDGRGAPPWSPDIIRNFIRPFDLSK